MIDGGRIGIGSKGRTLLDAFETPVVALSGSEDHTQGIAQRIERNNVGGGDSRHGKDVV